MYIVCLLPFVSMTNKSQYTFEKLLFYYLLSNYKKKITFFLLNLDGNWRNFRKQLHRA